MNDIELSTKDDIMIAQAEAVEAELKAMPAFPDDDTDERYCNWYLSQLEACNDAEKRLKEQAEVIQRQINARRSYLAYRHGPSVKRIVDDKLAKQKGSKKSIDFACGRAGYRKKPSSLLVQNKDEAIEWCAEHCPDALGVVIARRTPLKEYVEQHGEVPPGCEYIEPGDDFYPAVSQKMIDDHREQILRALPPEEQS